MNAPTRRFIENFDLARARDQVFGAIDREAGETEANYAVGAPRSTATHAAEHIKSVGYLGLYWVDNPLVTPDDLERLRTRALDAGMHCEEVPLGWVVTTSDRRRLEGLTEADALRRALDPAQPAMSEIFE